MVLTGAGISAESGIPTFRGPDGLWHGRRVEDVATAEAVYRDRWGVNEFFNERRNGIEGVKPNAAHEALVKLESKIGNNFILVTQNIDPLHEMAGSKNLIHMHGELFSIQCDNCNSTYFFQGDVKKETPCEKCGKTGSLRPDVVLFGEMPKMMDEILYALSNCDLFVAIGTSGVVYPAAGFVDVAGRYGAHTIEVNAADTERSYSFAERITGPASITVTELVDKIIGE